MQRISVVGCSGSGKSTLAKQLSSTLNIPYVELDALHWGPNWNAASGQELIERVSQAINTETWIVDGNYQGKLGTLIWDEADTVLWVNPPKMTVMWRSLKRTLHRIITQEDLWNGNRESWRSLLFWRGTDSILWWAWTSYGKIQQRYESAMIDPANAHLTFHRLRSTREVHHLLATLSKR